MVTVTITAYVQMFVVLIIVVRIEIVKPILYYLFQSLTNRIVLYHYAHFWSAINKVKIVIT